MCVREDVLVRRHGSEVAVGGGRPCGHWHSHCPSPGTQRGPGQGPGHGRLHDHAASPVSGPLAAADGDHAVRLLDDHCELKEHRTNVTQRLYMRVITVNSCACVWMCIRVGEVSIVFWAFQGAAAAFYA